MVVWRIPHRFLWEFRYDYLAESENMSIFAAELDGGCSSVG